MLSIKFAWVFIYDTRDGDPGFTYYLSKDY